MTRLNIFYILILTAASFTFSTAAHAQVQNSLEAQLAAKKSNFSLFTVIGTESSFHKDYDDQNAAAETGITLVPAYRINKTYNMNAIAGFRITHTSPQETTFGDTQIRLNHKVTPLTKNIKVMPSIAATLPTNEDARLEDTFRLGLTLRPLFISQVYIGETKIDTTYLPMFTKNFYEFERNRFREPNIEFSLSHLVNGQYSFSDKFFFSLGVRYATAWTFQSAFISRFSMDQTFSYVYKPNLIFSVGHSNSENALTPNGADVNARVFSDQYSRIFGQLLWTL